MDERFLEGLLDNVFGIFPNACLAKSKHKSPSLVALEQTSKGQFISPLCGSDELFLCSAITERSNGHGQLGNLVQSSTQHDAFTSRAGPCHSTLPLAHAWTMGKDSAKYAEV